MMSRVIVIKAQSYGTSRIRGQTNTWTIADRLLGFFYQLRLFSKIVIKS